MTTETSRREFLKRASALSVLGAATPLALNLAALGEAAAASATGGYKALVCIYLNGGNDWANTVVPYDATHHALYLNERPAPIGIARGALAATVLKPSAATQIDAGLQFALAPSLAPLLPLFDGGKLAVMMNLGTLEEPTTKLQYANRSVLLPAKLFSHNDQRSVYFPAAPKAAPRAGAA
jgi:uncharacterized protein (DUF1501 family)